MASESRINMYRNIIIIIIIASSSDASSMFDGTG